MRYIRLRLSVILSMVALVVVVMAGQFTPGPAVLAQEGDSCQQMVANAISQAGDACAGLAPGEICYGHAGVAVATSGGVDASFAASGDTVATASVETLTTMAADPASGEWGVAMVMLPGDVPEGETLAVTGILFGDGQIARPAQVQSDRPTLTVTNTGGAEVNLRNGAGVNFDVVGQLGAGEEAIADGRNQESDWIRIQVGDGMAWVFARLVSWEGDLNALEVLLPGDVTPVFEAGEPFQSFSLVTGAPSETCRAAASGLLLQFADEQAASLQVNQVNFEFSNATVLLKASPNNALEALILSGSGVVTARGIPVEASAGEAVRVNLGDENGVIPVAPPTAVGAYAFSEVAYVPASLLTNDIACMVGVPSADANVTLRVGPGEQRGTLADMNPNASYLVDGWASDPDGAPWWQLDTGAQKSWVAQSAVSALGACEMVAEVEPPPMVLAIPAAPSPGEGGVVDDGVADFAPGANSVWQMYPGTDNMSGDCTGAPAINFCDHLAAIAPASGGITWKGMEASPYYLTRLQPNVYSYAGPNILGTGTISMTLRFTSDTTVTMTQRLTLNSEPNCQHVYNYTGTRNW